MPTSGFCRACALLAVLAFPVAVVAAPPVVPPPPAAASDALRPPSADEQKAFADGMHLYEAGDPRGAELAWKAGYALGRDPAFLIRIGEAQEKAAAPQEAVQTYERYLRESPHGADRAEIEARVHRLDPRRQIPASPDAEGEIVGDMTRAPGTPDNLSSSPPVRAPAPAAAASAQARDDNLQDLMPLVQDELPRSRANVAAWVGVGVTTLLLGVAAFFGASAAEKSGDANRLLIYVDEKTGIPQEYASRASQFEEDVRVGRRDDRLAKGFAIAAGMTALTSAVLFIVDGASAKAEPTQQSRADEFGVRASVRRAPRLAATPLLASPLGLSWSF